jgi:hypothetical protein
MKRLAQFASLPLPRDVTTRGVAGRTTPIHGRANDRKWRQNRKREQGRADGQGVIRKVGRGKATRRMLLGVGRLATGDAARHP